jgi:hypothetical protein
VFRKSFGGGEELPIWRRGILQHFEHTEAVAARNLDVFGFADDSAGGAECVAENEFGEVGAVDGYCAHKESLFVGAKADGHAAVVFDGEAGHGGRLAVYALKVYIRINKEASLRSPSSAVILE